MDGLSTAARLITLEVNVVRFARLRSIDGPDESSDTLGKKGHHASADYVNREEASALQNLDEQCGENPT